MSGKDKQGATGKFISSLLADSVKTVSGGEANSDALRLIKDMAGMLGLNSKKTMTWIVMKAAKSPRLLQGLIALSRAMTRERGLVLVDTSLTSLLLAKSPQLKIFGLLLIGLVHKKFPFGDELKKRVANALSTCEVDSDEIVRDCANVISNFLGISSSLDSLSLHRVKESNPEVFEAINSFLFGQEQT